MSFYTDFAPHYERIFPFRPATLEFLRARLPARGRILDLGCGTGHYAGALAAHDLDMIGLDLDADMITAARERYAGPIFAVGDLTEAPAITGPADGAFCIGNVLPHLAPDRRHVFLRDLAAILPAGAPWIVQTVNFDRLLPLHEPHEFPDLEAGGHLVFRRRYEPAGDGAIRFLTTLARDDEPVFAGETALWPTTSRDLAADHAAAGFALDEQWGGFGGQEFDAAASGGSIQVYRRSAT